MDPGDAAASVLIVDDEPAVRQGLRPVLESEGVEVETAASAAEARRLLDRRAFDLVIVDLRLSGTHGEEGLEVISRVKERSPRSRVILFTAFGTKEIRDEARRRGACEMWEKSMPISELVRRIRALRGGSPREDA